ncbi:hypothetical protein DFH29DRAFT_784075, partial [Suillus ampliporus]
VDEDVLNGTAELLYFHCAADLQLYSTELLQLHSCLQSTTFQNLSFIVWHNNHYASYIYKKSSQLFHNDSMGHLPAPDVLCIFSWLLDSLDLPMPTTIQSEALSKQTASVGYGSCGIVAHNFIEAEADD